MKINVSVEISSEEGDTRQAILYTGCISDLFQDLPSCSEAIPGVSRVTHAGGHDT